MKVLTKISFLILALALSFTACKKAPEGVDSKTTEAKGTTATANTTDKQYKVTGGQLQWTGTKVGGQHMGTVKVADGTISANNGKITSGTVNVDMKTITVTDLKAGDGKEDLEGHLKNDDFFAIDKFPTATFKVTSVANNGATSNVTGDLTLRGVTKSITIPANVVAAGDKISIVTPAFKVNRTDFGIQYKSGLLNTAKDKIIHDEIGLVLNIEGSAN